MWFCGLARLMCAATILEPGVRGCGLAFVFMDATELHNRRSCVPRHSKPFDCCDYDETKPVHFAHQLLTKHTLCAALASCLTVVQLPYFAAKDCAPHKPAKV